MVSCVPRRRETPWTSSCLESPAAAPVRSAAGRRQLHPGEYTTHALITAAGGVNVYSDPRTTIRRPASNHSSTGDPTCWRSRNRAPVTATTKRCASGYATIHAWGASPQSARTDPRSPAPTRRSQESGFRPRQRGSCRCSNRHPSDTYPDRRQTRTLFRYLGNYLPPLPGGNATVRRVRRPDHRPGCRTRGALPQSTDSSRVAQVFKICNCYCNSATSARPTTPGSATNCSTGARHCPRHGRGQ